MSATATRAIIDGWAWNWALHFGCQAADEGRRLLHTFDYWQSCKSEATPVHL